MKYEVILKVFQDDGNGEWGIAPENSIDEQFNAFWRADGIFHDVFEHYFEGYNRHFSDKYAFQLFGEMCASGHAIAYRDIGIDSFRYRSYTGGRDFTADTYYSLEEWFVYGSEMFPIDHCKVPRHVEDSYNLNYWLHEYFYKLDAMAEKRDIKLPRKLKTQIRNCYCYGYKTARKIIGHSTEHSYKVMDKFLTEWNDITKSDVKSLHIDNESAAPIRAFKFVVNSSPKLKVKTTIIDEYRGEYPMSSLLPF